MTLKLVHTFGKNAGDVQTVSKDVVRFGRAPDNDVVFDPNYDRDASSHHAEIRLESGSYWVVDLKSKNGTYIKGVRITRQALQSGDEITFGSKGPRVRVEVQAIPAAAHAPAANGPAQPARPAPSIAKGGTAAMPQHDGKPAPPPAAPSAVAAISAPPPQPAPAAPPAAAPAPAARAPIAPVAAAPMIAQAPVAHAPVAHPPVVHPPVAAPPPPAAIPQAPPAGKRVGQRTIAYMIQSAVAAARGRPSGHNTQQLSAFVDQKVDQATAGQKRTTYVLGALLLVALAGLGGLVYWSTRSSDEIASLRGQLATLPPDDPRRKDIESRLGTLHPANASFGRNLYDRYKKGIFMLAAGGEGFCTAFAVRPNVLATNAHCVVAAKKHTGIVAIENESGGKISYAVSDMKAHPSYRDQDANALTPDVGIVTISGKAAVVLDIASAAELQQTGAGDDVYLIGFPGRLMDTQNPSATFLAAHVGRLTNALGRPGAFADTWLVQHDAQTTHGTSGSPVFNGRGKVIAINAGGYLAGDDETIAGKKTEVVKASPYKFGMRIDLLDAILK